MSEISAAQLALVTSFRKLIELLRDKLDWPIGEDYGFDDIVYEYEADDLGLKENEVAKIREIHQLRPLVTGQPWGIFFISFEDKSISVAVLRRILRALVVKKRAGAQTPDRQTWNLHDLIFVANFGRSGEREIAFAHFSDTAGDLPVLNVLGWNAKDTALHNDYVGQVLSDRLRWPDDPTDRQKWREMWGEAFELRIGEVARTSQDLARQLAGLASNIRARANQLLSAETDEGPMRQLLSAFRKNLLHDLDEDGFADMFAQTICYGMLAARISRPIGIVADNLADMVPRTNPFLKELFASFLKIGGRDKRQGMDFDELGIRNVVDMLNAANMEAVLRDFGDRNPKEDPVIHFYELFLKEYDPKKRMQRGVFYTPRPVVNFIVRGVDDILRKEFGLPLGLADTTTWGELAARNDKVTVPKHIDPARPFVQVLDPATGTGTFLVEVIDLIHKRMDQHWQDEGKSEAEVKAAWNAYVPAHLLPRLTAFELMMAPYTIAHMKVGLKLSETGYTFGSDERARIFLTNALEPARDLEMEFSFMSEALAHEAQASNDAKARTSFTVVVGNPPYSVKSFNMGRWITELCEPYKESVRKEESQIQSLSNDYIKFMRLGHASIQRSGCGVFGMITGHGYMLGSQPRDLRKSLSETFGNILAINLNGSVRRDDVAGQDEPVFEIMTGVGIGIFSTLARQEESCAQYVSVEGSYDQKMDWLMKEQVAALVIKPVRPLPKNYFFWRTGWLEGEFGSFTDLPDFFGTGSRNSDKEVYWSTGFATQQDDFAISFSEEELEVRMSALARSRSRAEISTQYRMCSTDQWDYDRAVQYAKSSEWKQDLGAVSYRPFDSRLSVINSNVVTILKDAVQRNFSVDNCALLVSRVVNDLEFAHAFVSNHRVDKIFLSSKTSTNTYVMPLWLSPHTGEPNRRPNIAARTAASFGESLELKYQDGIPQVEGRNLAPNHQRLRGEQAGPLDTPWEGRGDLKDTFGPRDLFDYIYAVLHSPGYRSRYAEFLKSDFPRIPTPKTSTAFRSLSALGSQLVGLHLVRPEDAPPLATPDIRFAGNGEARVEKGYPEYRNGRVMINATRWFEDVPRETWEFHVGGYQVCEKWLKDRAGRGGKNPSPGRVLSDEDILQYRRVVTALTETRRLMAEIDQVIDAHGGWPDAFDVPPPPPPSIEEIIKADESLELEFKTTFQWDVKERKQNKDLQKSVLKTLAAFMNTEGGTLVIGVTDEKEIHGLEDDLKLTRDSVDVFEQNLLSALSNSIGVAYAQHISVRFAEAPGEKTVCVIVAAPSPEPVFLEFQGKHEFYIRRGNASIALNPSEQHTYVRQHFKAN